jgi:hypothetical protein
MAQLTPTAQKTSAQSAIRKEKGSKKTAEK